MKKTFVLAFFSILLTTAVQAQKPVVVWSNKPGWHKIGETTVDFKAEKDALLVLGADSFKDIAIKVTDAPIHIHDLTVYYENGQSENIQLRNDFNPGDESRIINLNGQNRKLKKVVFDYGTVANWRGEKGHVELYGLK